MNECAAVFEAPHPETQYFGGRRLHNLEIQNSFDIWSSWLNAEITSYGVMFFFFFFSQCESSVIVMQAHYVLQFIRLKA